MFLHFLKSEEMCSERGWDTASGISREQFEALVGDVLVGWTGGSIKIMKLLNFLEWKGPCSIQRRHHFPVALCHLQAKIKPINQAPSMWVSSCLKDAVSCLHLCRSWSGDNWWRIAWDVAEPFQTCSRSVIAEKGVTDVTNKGLRKTNLVSLCVYIWMWISHYRSTLNTVFLAAQVGSDHWWPKISHPYTSNHQYIAPTKISWVYIHNCIIIVHECYHCHPIVTLRAEYICFTLVVLQGSYIAKYNSNTPILNS